MKKPTLFLVPGLLSLMLMPLTAEAAPSAKSVARENKILDYYGRQEPSTKTAPKTAAEADPADELPEGLHLTAAKKTNRTAPSTASTKYTVKKGDTLTKISGRTGVPVAKLMQLNSLKGHNLNVGQTLNVASTSSSTKAVPTKTASKSAAEPPTPKPAPSKLYYVKHEVKRGETVAQLARKYEVSAESILLANNLPEDATLTTGRTVSVPVRGSATKLSKSSESTKGVASKQSYSVQGKDTFYSLSTQYGISVDELKAANPGVTPERLRTGMVLNIPVRGGRDKSPTAVGKSNEETTTPPAQGFAPQDLHQNKNIKPVQSSAKAAFEPISLETLPLEIAPEGVDPYFDYTIEPHDTWQTIGAQFHTSGDEIRRINGAKSTDEPQIGSTISVPRTRIGIRPSTRAGNRLG